MIPRIVLSAAVTAVLCSLWVAPAPAATLPAGATALLSGGPSLFEALPTPAGHAYTGRTAVSTTGRFVAFASVADGLSDADDDRVQNVYVKDRDSGAVTLVSRRSSAGGEPSHDNCYDPAISDDGTRVGFTCAGSLDPADDNQVDDVYVRDLGSGDTILVSRATGEQAVGNRPSFQPVLSATGEYVAFVSSATNLGDPGNDGQSRVLRRRIGNGDHTIVVSRQAQSLGGAAIAGTHATISDNGNRIGFTTSVPAIGTFDGNNAPDVYVYDVTLGFVILASRASLSGPVGDHGSQQSSISGNGNFIAFESAATNLSAADKDQDPDVYRRTLSGGSDTVLVSINPAGTAKPATARGASLDASGQVVGFTAQVGAAPFHPDDTNGSADAYVKNLATNQLQIVSRGDGDAGPVANADAGNIAVSGDGQTAATQVDRGITPDADPRRRSVVVRDLDATPRRTFTVSRPAGDVPFRNVGGRAQGGALSDDGRYAAFRTNSAGIGVPDDAEHGVFVRDRVTGAAVLASRADGPDGEPFKTRLSRPAISADGRRVAFTAQRPGSVLQDVWVRDVPTGRTFLATPGLAGAPANATSEEPALDADGSRVAFWTYASNLTPDDKDQMPDVLVRDLAAGATLLVSRADGPTGVKGDGYSTGPDISADGTLVVFRSHAVNLGDGDKDAVADAHLRDLAAGTTRLVSAEPGGAVKTDDNVETVSIDASGAKVAFSGFSKTLLGDTSPEPKAFLRDLAAGTLVLAGRADGPGGALVEATDVRISPDGGYIAFASRTTSLAPGLPEDVVQVYRRDLAAGRTELVSRRGGLGGPAVLNALPLDISARGGCVSFSSDDTLVGSHSDYAQSYVRAFRADCALEDPRPAAPVDGGEGAAGPVSGGAAGGAGPRAARDATAPVLSAPRLSRRRFRVARGATALAAAAGRGTTLTFRASEAAQLSIDVERVRQRRVGKRRRVTYRRAGLLTRRVRAGAGRVALTGRLGKRPMASGRYRLVLVATDAAGNRSKPVRLTFSILRG